MRRRPHQIHAPVAAISCVAALEQPSSWPGAGAATMRRRRVGWGSRKHAGAGTSSAGIRFWGFVSASPGAGHHLHPHAGFVFDVEEKRKGGKK